MGMALLPVLIFAAVALYLVSIQYAMRRNEAERRAIGADVVLAPLGATPDDRERNILDFCDKKEKTEFYIDERARWVHNVFHIELSRHLSAMEPRELAALRIAYVLFNRNLIDRTNFDAIRLGVVWGDGKGLCMVWTQTYGKPDVSNSIDNYVRKYCSSGAAAAVSLAFSLFGVAPKDHPSVVKLQRYLTGGGNAWLRPEEVEQSEAYKSNPANPYHLLLGHMPGQPDGSFLTYSEGRSVVTIAPPGAGKTQCLVIPNLLHWPGSAIVLDAKGELYDMTADYRAEHFGRVIRFAPLEPENSASFNPLAFVRGERYYVWEDAAELANLIIGESRAKDRFWEDRARDLLTLVIADLCFDVPVEERAMGDLVEAASGTGWIELLARAGARTDLQSMVDAAKTFEGVDPKVFSSILQTARNAVAPWGGERVRAVTQRCDWQPSDLRGDEKLTLYVCLRMGEMETFSSVLRVFIALHMRYFLKAKMPSHSASPILFLLDETPVMKYMPPLRDGIELGRSYKLQLWLIAQNEGQFEEHYKNAKGLLSGCAVRVYMNPSLHDGTAQRISEQIGYRESPLDGKRELIVQPAELAGPDFNDDMVLLAAGTKPARLKKVFAHADPRFSKHLKE